MKRRSVAILLLASLVLNGCSLLAGRDDKDAVNEHSEKVQQEDASLAQEGDPVQETSEEGSAAGTDPADTEENSYTEEFDGPVLRKGTYYDYIDTYTENIEGDYKSFGKIRIDYLKVFNDGYENLNSALDEDFEQRKEASSWYQNVVRESIGYMDELDEATGMPWPYEDSISVERADDDVVSYMSSAYSYTGGAHGGTTIAGATFDVQTGEKLALKDVVSDFDEFYDVVYKMLEEDQEDFFEEWRETVHRDLYEDSAENGAFAWVLGKDCIKVTFGDYELGAFALGHVSKTVYASDHPGLIKSEYVSSDTSLCQEVLSYESAYADIDNDGEDEQIDLEVIPEYDEEYDTVINTEIKVHVTKGETTKSASNKVNNDGWGDDLDFECAYLLETLGGKYYLVADTSTYNDWEGLYVFDLNENAAPVFIERSPVGAFYGFIPRSADDVLLSTRVDVMGTYSVHRECYLSDEGEFVPYDEEYIVTDMEHYLYDVGVSDDGADTFDPYSVTTSAQIEAYTDRDKTGTVTIPSGTKLYPLRTNGLDYMVFEQPDGSEACIFYDEERDPEVFERLINGKPESELFEMLPYAG